MPRSPYASDQTITSVSHTGWTRSPIAADKLSTAKSAGKVCAPAASARTPQPPRVFKRAGGTEYKKKASQLLTYRIHPRRPGLRKNAAPNPTAPVSARIKDGNHR